MAKTIDEFVQELPNLKTIDKAEIMCKEVKSPTNFPRIELTGEFDTLSKSVRMVYVLGRGEMDLNEDEERKKVLFYLPEFVTRNFLGLERPVKAIPLYKISMITPLNQKLLDVYTKSEQ